MRSHNTAVENAQVKVDQKKNVLATKKGRSARTGRMGGGRGAFVRRKIAQSIKRLAGWDGVKGAERELQQARDEERKY